MIYAIGDVHGCLGELHALEDMIVADAAGMAGEKWLVMLGDYIDRGPSSAQVIDHLLAPPPAGFQRTCLVGNHEEMLLAFLENPRRGGDWLENGGDTTLASYGVDLQRLKRSSAKAKAAALDALMPLEHREFLKGLPILVDVPGYAFVHAGLAPGVPLDRQDDADLIWIRERFLDAVPTPGLVVVHGHTPGTEPVVKPARIGIDTAAYATGRLTAVRIGADGSFGFLSTGQGR